MAERCGFYCLDPVSVHLTLLCISPSWSTVSSKVACNAITLTATSASVRISITVLTWQSCEVLPQPDAKNLKWVFWELRWNLQACWLGCALSKGIYSDVRIGVRGVQSVLAKKQYHLYFPLTYCIPCAFLALFILPSKYFDFRP